MKRRRRVKKFNSVMKNSLYIAFIAVIAVCAALIGKLVWINNQKGDEYAKKVLSQQAYSRYSASAST